MAKTYAEIFLDSAETQYASGLYPLLAIASQNDGVKFSPITQSNGFGGTVNTYAIQRMKRIKATDSPMNSLATAEPSAGSAFGTDLVAGLNALSKVEWDTVTTQTSQERIIGVTVEPFEELSPLLNASPYERAIMAKTKNTMVEAEEHAIKNVVDAVTAGNKADIAAIGTTAEIDAVYNQIVDAKNDVELLVDDFKAYSDKVFGVVHPKVADALAKLEGVEWQNGSNTFPTLANSKIIKVGGVELFVHPVLNAIESSTGKVPGVIIMDSEVYGNAGFERAMVTFDENYLGTRAVGHRYHFLDKVVDPSRIKMLEYTTATPSAKVND